MGKRRRFTREFKRQVVEELLSGVSAQAQLIRRYDLSYNLLLNWRRAYEDGRLDDRTQERAKDARIRELERKVGELTMEIDLLKGAAKVRAYVRSENGSVISGPVCDRSDGDAK